MARDTITPQTLVRNSGTVATASTITPANGGSISAPTFSRRMFVLVRNSGTVNGTVTVTPGNNPPAFLTDLGTLVFTVPASSDRVLLLESARFVQTGGGYLLDYNTGMTGTVYAYEFPRDF